jgi:ribonuclease P protein component
MIAKDFRLKRNQINYLLNKGDSLSSKLFIARYVENNKDFSGFCVIISRKLSGKAVERNRLRRQIYEAIRTSGLTEKSTNNVDIALIPKKPILKKSFSEIKEDLINLQSKWTSRK